MSKEDTPKTEEQKQAFKKFLKSNKGEIFIHGLIGLRDSCNKLAGHSEEDAAWLKKMRNNCGDINTVEDFEENC